MDLKLELTEDQHWIVQAHCDTLDKHLTKFKQSQDLEDFANSAALSEFQGILHLEDEDVRSAIMRYLASREELFEIVLLIWDILFKRSTSNLSDIESLDDWICVIVDLTHCSDDICLAFGQKGLLRVFIEYLKISNGDEERKGDRDEYSLTSTLTLTIYNCCWRVPENRIMCREYIDILQNCSQTVNLEIQPRAFLALSYIIDKSEAHKIPLNKPCLELLLLILQLSMGCTWKTTHGYSALEILQGLNQLAINDSNKLLIVELFGIELLQQVLVEEGSNNEEKLWAARVIWQLAFKEENKVIMRRRKSLLDALKRIKETSEDRDVKDACSGALFVINDVFDIDDEVKEDTPAQEGQDVSGHSAVKSDASPGLAQGHIMISYQHASQERMLRVKSYLEECGYNVWMDVDKMRGDILDTMAKAVQRSSVVLVGMTSKFKESQHCRTEATYAYTLNKDIVPLMLQDQFAPNDWLGALVGMKMYYPLYSDDVMRESLPDLVRELGERGKHETPVIPAVNFVTGTSSPTVTHGQFRADDTMQDDVDGSGGMKDDKPTDSEDNENSRSEKVADVDTWDEKEAGEWLRSHDIDTSKNSFKYMNGTRLKQIKHLLKLAPEFCLKSLKDELGLDLWDVLSLVDALKKL